MFRLCKVNISVNSLQNNDITKNQSERLREKKKKNSEIPQIVLKL